MRHVLAALVLSASILPAHAELAAPGVYTEACLPTVTCSVTITKTGKKHVMTWTATDRTGRIEYCRYTIPLKVGTGRHREELIPGVLVGSLPKTNNQIIVMPFGDEGAEVWLYTDANVCPGTGLPESKGHIGINGFYVLEGDV